MDPSMLMSMPLLWARAVTERPATTQRASSIEEERQRDAIVEKGKAKGRWWKRRVLGGGKCENDKTVTAAYVIRTNKHKSSVASSPDERFNFRNVSHSLAGPPSPGRTHVWEEKKEGVVGEEE